MINTLLEHVPIKMEARDIDEATTDHVANDDTSSEMAKDDDKIDETDEELDEDDDDEFDEEDDDEDEEESDTESDALEIEKEATMLISSDEEAELEAQRIRFPDIIITKKLRKDSNKSSRSSSRNSLTSNISSKPQIANEVVPKKVTIEDAAKKQRISPRLKNSENNNVLESLNNENNNINNNSNAPTLLKKKTDNKKLENNKNKQDDTSKQRLDNNSTTTESHKNCENNRNKENLLKSPVNVPGQKSRRGSNNSTCSVVSSVASDSGETESCGNIFVFNLQQKLIFNCEFCDLKYGDLENFGRHLHETHNLFNFDEDPEKENAPRNLRKSNRMPNSAPKNSANVKKEPLQCLELLAEPPVALPPSVLAEPLDSCGNVFVLNHRKLFLVCGYCECKYANVDLFEKHLRQQHRIFEGCRNEVNVVPKVEVKEEVFIITEVVEKPDIIASQAMVAIPADIPLNKSITPENEAETLIALEQTMETSEEIKENQPTLSSPALVTNALEPSQTKEQENTIKISVVLEAKESEKLPQVENNEKISAKKTRSKRRPSPVKSAVSPSKRPKRNTRNNTRAQKEESATPNVEDQIPKINSETVQTPEEEKITEIPIVKENNNTGISIISAESIKDTFPEIIATAENQQSTTLNESELTEPIKITESRETRKSTKTARKEEKSTSVLNKETRKREEASSKKQSTKKVKTKANRKGRKSKKTTVTKKVTPAKSATKTRTAKSETETKTSEGKLKCSICPKKFARKDTLEVHERTHTGEKPYECEVCHKTFGARANLYMHKKFHMGDSYKKYKCEICDKKFFRNTDRKVHMASHSKEKGFKCGICMRGYSSKLSVKKHYERYHSADSTAAKSKKKTAQKEILLSAKVEEDAASLQLPTNITALIQPMQETPPPQVNNEMDDLNADPVDDIIEQLQNEMLQNEQENVEANAVTYTINTLPGSEVTNGPSNNVGPTVVGPQLNDVDSTDDVKPTLLKVVKRFFCDVCPRAFDKHIRLVEHKRLHTGEKPFTCDECGKQFRIRMRLKGHKLRHSKEKKFKCEICQLGCCTKQDLNLHMRHHTNDRRYQCTMCPKAFVRGSDLKIHIRVHTGEKPYVCDICHKCFRANQNLGVHKKSHMGEASKTYKCEHCDKKFIRKMDRKVHMRSHTGEKPYKCEICQRGYSSKFNVRAHIERDHISANGVGTPPKGKKKPGPKPKALNEELEKQKKLIEELQYQLLQQIKTDEKIIPSEEEMLQQDSTITATSPLTTSTKMDPIQSAYELLNKLKSSSTTSKPLTVIPSPPPMVEPPSNPFTKSNKDSTNLLPLTITQKLEQASPASSSSSATPTPSPPKTTATKVVSQKTSLGIQQVSVTVSMQVENVTPNTTNSEKENAGLLTTSSTSSTTSVKKERKITSYFTVVGQKAEV